MVEIEDGRVQRRDLRGEVEKKKNGETSQMGRRARLGKSKIGRRKGRKGEDSKEAIRMRNLRREAKIAKFIDTFERYSHNFAMW